MKASETNYESITKFLSKVETVTIDGEVIELTTPTHTDAAKVKDALAEMVNKPKSKGKVSNKELMKDMEQTDDMMLLSLKACHGGVDAETLSRFMMAVRSNFPEQMVELATKSLRLCGITVDESFIKWLKLFYGVEDGKQS